MWRSPRSEAEQGLQFEAQRLLAGYREHLSALAVGPAAPHPVFGHFVGGSIALRGAGFTHHWVQDLGRVLARKPALAQLIRF